MTAGDADFVVTILVNGQARQLTADQGVDP